MNRVFTVNFGSAKTGLATVGYTLKDINGATYQVRTTAGVAEFTGPGIYGANVTLPDTFNGTIEWDTGEATPVYAAEDIALDQYSLPVAAAVSTSVTGNVIDDVRTLLRAHLNQLVDFINKKFTDFIIPPVDFKPLADEMVKMKTEIADNIHREDESINFTPVLGAVEKLRREVEQREKMLVDAVRGIQIPNHTQKLEEISRGVYDPSRIGKIASQVDEVKKMLGMLNDYGHIRMNILEEKLSQVVDSVKKALTEEASWSLVPNFENKLGKLEGKMGSEVGKISGMINEIHPDNLEKKRLENEKNQNNLNFIAGVKPWQK